MLFSLHVLKIWRILLKFSLPLAYTIIFLKYFPPNLLVNLFARTGGLNMV